MRRFILKTKEQIKNACNYMATLPQDEMYCCEIKPYKATKTHEQHQMMWGLLRQLSNSGLVCDVTKTPLSPEGWHDYLRCIFGYVDGTRRVFLGKAGSVEAPNPKSSTDMNIEEMSEYISQIEVFMSEHGVFARTANET